jgi:LytR cell envelope-related transcriptional attenuator
LAGVVQEIGGAAGLAAVVGLTLLAALHLSQARDVRRLREWAGRAPGRSAPGVAAVPRRTPWHSRIPAHRVVAALAGLLVLGGATAYGVTRLSGDGGGDSSGNAQANNHKGSADKPRHNGTAVKPGSVTVAVLNGTTVPGLAATLRDQLAVAGFRKGTIDVFSDHQLVESVVQYAPGQQAAAEAVGRRLGISQRGPVTPDSRALAGDATVIVIAGADMAP